MLLTQHSVPPTIGIGVVWPFEPTVEVWVFCKTFDTKDGVTATVTVLDGSNLPGEDTGDAEIPDIRIEKAAHRRL